jgi:CubicO group peptidase (beta-lactamase class C family)
MIKWGAEENEPIRQAGRCVMRSTSRFQPIAAALFGAGLALGAGHSVCAESVKVEFPAKPDPTELPEVWPEDVGVSSDQLVKLSKWIRDQKLDIRSLVIVKDGKIAFERYSDGLTRDKNYELYSITKALTAVLAGDLIADGKISLDSSVKDVIGPWRPDLKEAVADKEDVKLGNVLNMTTGLYYDFKPPNDPIYYEAPDRLKLAATTTPLLRPGKVFQYMDVNPILATAMLSAAAGKKLEDYAEEKVFKPLGMKHYAWTRADEKGLVSGGWGLRLRAVDMARLGMLALQDGQWEGKQMAPADWIKTITTGQSTPFFGYYWWVHNIVEGGVEGGDQPEFDTMGFKGQNIVVLPKYNAVVTMTSILSPDGGLRDAKCLQILRYMMSEYILPALDQKASASTEAQKTALLDELQAAEDSKGVPGFALDPNNTDVPQ